MCRTSETPLDLIERGLALLPAWAAEQPANQQGALIIRYRQVIDRTEAASAEATRRFEKSGGYRADGALGMVPWLREHGKLNGGAAAEHVETARQLENLPRTEEALARGEIGYQHAVAMAKTAEHVGAAAVRRAEATLLKSAETMDPGQFTGVVRDFEHGVDAEAALHEANRAHQRRYLQISEPSNGLVRIEGQLVTETAARLQTAIDAFMKPRKGDERTYAQRMHDGLDQLLQGSTAASRNGAGQRPQIIIKTSADTLASIAGAPAGELQWGGKIPAETVRRLACDAAITRIIGLGELAQEITNASRTMPPAKKRALVARDQHCVFPGCDRPAPWCEGHHLVFWADGGPTTLENLALVCGAHHRKVHEEGWKLERRDGRWTAIPPVLKVVPRSRSS